MIPFLTTALLGGNNAPIDRSQGCENIRYAEPIDSHTSIQDGDGQQTPQSTPRTTGLTSPTDRTPIGMTVASFQGLGTDAMIQAVQQAASLGAASIWTAETTGPEAFTTLAGLAPHAPGCDLGTGIVPLQIRTPLLAAQAATTLQAFNPSSQVLLGVGISSPVVVGQWHGAHYGSTPIAETKAYVQLLRSYLAGDTVTTSDSDFYTVTKSAMRIRHRSPMPRIVLAALNENMLTLAGRMADGVLLNYLPATAVPWCVEKIRRGELDAGREPGSCVVYAYVHVGVCDPDRAEESARRDLYSYAVVEGYANAFARAGFDAEIETLRRARAAGDRDAALAAISRRMIDAIDVCGDETHIRNAVSQYVDAGVDHPVVMPLPWGEDRRQTIADTLSAALSTAPSAQAPQ